MPSVVVLQHVRVIDGTGAPSFPADVAVGITYVSGDYHGSLDKLLTHVDRSNPVFNNNRTRVLAAGRATLTYGDPYRSQ